ncbi:PrgI family protein [Patescibacteria group bacterium]|nr:PrgI family protein [Patescibacteria group bacterium]
MEQHPVPQNVTTFQFRLIGDMTIKQFGYLAGGVILAYLCYKLPLPFFFTWPLTLLTGLGGFGLAFVPIEERPMDVWIMSFFKNVYSPTQYVWQKTKQPELHAASSVSAPDQKPGGAQDLRGGPPGAPAALSQTPHKQGASLAALVRAALFPAGTIAHSDTTAAHRPALSANTPPAATTHIKTPPLLLHRFSYGIGAVIARIKRLFAAPAVSPKTTPQYAFSDVFASLHAGPKTSPHKAQPSRPPAILETLRPETPSFPIPFTPIPTIPHTPQPLATDTGIQTPAPSNTRTEPQPPNPQSRLTVSPVEKERMEQQLHELNRHASAAPSATYMTPSAPGKSSNTVRVIAPEGTIRAGIPRLTTVPNVVTGIIKNETGDLLPGILITVRDFEGVPLRALKSNKLGQFAASTPLQNGTYVIEVEDPRGKHHFDRAQITLAGNQAPALEISAKTEKQLNRERLEREIFGRTPGAPHT